MENLYKKLSVYSVYFEIIRRKLLRLGIVFLVSFAIGFTQSGKIIRSIISLFKLDNVSIITTSPFQFLELSTRIGIICGLIMVLPLASYYIFRFVKDGLRKKEKFIFFLFLICFITLFIIGFLYSFGILYVYLSSVSKISSFTGIINMWDVNSFLSQILITSIVFGFIFQFPIFLTFLIRLGILKLNFLKSKRRYAVAFIFMFVGFLPPPDILSTLIQAAPLIVLFEITLRLNSLFPPLYEIERRRAEKLEIKTIEEQTS